MHDHQPTVRGGADAKSLGFLGPRIAAVTQFGGIGSRLMVACAGPGAVLGALSLWLWHRESQADTCTTLSDGSRACMPVLIVPPPLWAYFAFAVAGALAALLLAVVTVNVRRWFA